MSDKDLIIPSGIPQFTGNLAQLETDSAALTTEAGNFRSSGASVHSTFQGLSAFYHAPEADQLFATTAPVATKSDAFADDLEKVATALSVYGTEVRPLVKRLESLQTDAFSFLDSIEGDDDWREDEKKVNHNNALVDDVRVTTTAFWAAERSCHGKIIALVAGGTPLITDDGSHKPNMYGYKADDLKHAEETPWGSTTEQEYTGLAWAGHQVKSFVWDGFIMDGVVGTFKGLGTLVVADGWDAAGQAWTSLAKLATGVVLTATPVTSALFWLTPDDKLPSWIRDSRTAMKETGKALVAWDEWEKNPSRAAGTVSFNVITTIVTGGTGTAAKAGGVARAVSIAGKAGRLVDPITYVAKGGKFAFSKVGDLMVNLKQLRTSTFADIPGGTYKLPELTDVAPGRPAILPKNTIQLVDRQGKTVYLDADSGALFDESGKVLQSSNKIPHEPSAAERAPDHATEPNPLPQREPVLVGAHVGDDAVGAGGRGGDHLPPGGTAHDFGRGPSATHEPPAGPPRGSTPSHGDNGTGALPPRGGFSHGAGDGADAQDLLAPVRATGPASAMPPTTEPPMWLRAALPGNTVTVGPAVHRTRASSPGKPRTLS
ncbi:hypothetical protein [Streptomyces sp. H27-D2]|uniref:hypothetical protein n=1 Tax=Streptomyces sp. H27-D2 TaxID=3046304 RepID=UPI002DC03F29|nr:hypothetical protein [Streptomyces sp. H27-D2]MEC4016748.1 hypothetical protein [Streptomyces sp. H27-D2]